MTSDSLFGLLRALGRLQNAAARAAYREVAATWNGCAGACGEACGAADEVDAINARLARADAAIRAADSRFVAAARFR